MNPSEALAGLWQLAGLPGPALAFASLTGHDPVLPSSFAVGTAAQATMLRWQAVDFETAAATAGLVATALRSFDEWDATEQGRAVAQQPLFR